MIHPIEAPVWEGVVPWVKPNYSRNQVNNAGKALIESSNEVELQGARKILSNWRAAHGFPLNTLTMTLRRRARKVHRRALVAQRLKRLVSLENKMLRQPNRRATQMQDIGGCRVILPDMAAVKRMVGLYHRSSSRVFELHRTDDYIEQPKNTGYRSLHLVYRYDSPKQPLYRNMRMELQIRSRDQHAWATAVEAVGFFIGHDLKAYEGDEHWLRFFLIAAHWISLKEMCPGVPGVPERVPDFADELVRLWRSLDVDSMLSAWARSFELMTKHIDVTRAWRYLLRLDASKRMIYIWPFTRPAEALASDRYAELESEFREDPNQHVLLVSAESVAQLRRAYPGFFADTTRFRDTFRDAFGISK